MTDVKAKPDSQLQGMSAGPGALMGGATYKSDYNAEKAKKESWRSWRKHERLRKWE
jgi:hypothetical protein